jgi:hypothetical protein
MTDLSNLAHVKKIQSDMRSTFDSPAGQEVMKFLEEVCGWYDFSQIDPNAVLVAHGKRQVLASIKTLLKHSAEEIQSIARQQKEQ